MTHRSPETIALAIQIADSVARSDLECALVCTRINDTGPWWWDTQPPDPNERADDDLAWITPLVTYLELRGLITRHADFPHLISFVDPTQGENHEQT